MMNKLFNFLSILSLVVVAGYSSAYAQRSAPKKHNGLSQQSTEKRSKIHDPAIVVDTFGIRVGMTLRQAQEAIKKHGVSFSDLSFNYNTKHWHEGPAPEIFKLPIIAPANYDGPEMQGASVFLYPKDPKVSYKNFDNMIVYAVGSGARGFNFADRSNVSNPDMPKDVMMDKIKKQFPKFIDVQGEKAFQDIKHCYNAQMLLDEVYQLAPYKRAGSKRPLSNRGEDVSVGWRKCGDVLAVNAATHSDKGVHNLIVLRFNYVLMEEAHNNISQMVGYNEEIKAAVAQEK